MKDLTPIGQLIMDEINRQRLTKKEVYDAIPTTKQNFDNMLQRPGLDVITLGKIGNCLKCDLFKRISETPSLLSLEDPKTLKYLEEKRAISQFVEVVPDVLHKLGKSSVIAFSSKRFEKEVPNLVLPDFILPDYEFTFTKGGGLFTAASNGQKVPFQINHINGGKGKELYIWYNPLQADIFFDLELIYRKEEEWFETMKWAFQAARYFLFHSEYQNNFIELINKL